MADVVHETGGEQHGHDHPAHVQHHFDTSAQQFDASKLGMWLFLATEILFFGGLFCAYAIFRRTHPEIFDTGQHFLNVWLGATNTAVLIASSFTMALGVWCAQKSHQRGLVICLVLTLVGAVTFLVIKYFEYAHKIEHGKVWGKNFYPTPDHPLHPAGGHGVFGEDQDAHPAEPAAHPSAAEPPPAAGTVQPDAAQAPPADALAAVVDDDALKLEASLITAAHAAPPGLNPTVLEPPTREELDYAKAQQMKNLHIFMGIYYCMTGLHGIHVLAGIGVITWLLINALKGKYNSRYYTPVDLVGLYWHVVDLVWIYLFPLFYLID